MNNSADKIKQAVQEQALSQLAAGDVEGVDSLSKVRDILFGSQVKDFDRRFDRLEKRLLKEIEGLKTDTRQRIESLDAYVREEMDSLGDGIKEEQTDRAAALKDVAKEIKDQGAGLEKKIGQLDDKLAKTGRSLRQQILDQSNTLRDESEGRHEQLQATVDREAQDLRDSKTDRGALAELLIEMGMRLNEDLEVPQAK